MKSPGRYKLLGGHRARSSRAGDLALGGALRAQRIVDSLRWELAHNQAITSVRIRQVFSTPREIFRVEIEAPEQGYLRTTLLDREALDELMETDEIRTRLPEAPGEADVLRGTGG